jgi:hypothetical protein
MLFPSHVKRVIFCFTYSYDHQPTFIYPTLEEKILQPYVVDVDLISSLHPVPKDEFCIPIHPELDNSSEFVEVEIDSKPTQSSLPFSLTSEPCHQPINFHDQPNVFQIKIIMKMFKPLRLPYLLHPYPLDFLEYLPRFSREDHATVESHLGTFENFVDQFEIVHDDVIMRLFSKSLFRDVAIWFKCLRDDSIGSWIELSNVFSKHWGENKSLDLYIADFYALKREENELFPVLKSKVLQHLS